MMKRVLVLQHVEHEGLGIFEGILKKRGFSAEYVRLFRDERLPQTANGYSSLIVLGGPIGVYEEERHPFLKCEVTLIQRTMEGGIPIIGICLGAQLIAKAAGAEISIGEKKEIGWYPVRLAEEGRRDPLLAGLPDEFTVFQWHGDTFDIPDGAVNLASSKLFPNQAIRIRDNVYGLQFHLEVTEDMVREWLEVNKQELESVREYIDNESILQETPHALPTLNLFGETFFSRFLELAHK